MPYHKKRFLSYTIVILCFLTAYTCRLIHTNNSLIQALVDQSRTSIYLGMYCAWVIYLNKHVVYKRMRQCLTVIGCLMVFWFFLRTVKYHIFQDPLSTHICWYLYYFPMILIPTLGLNASFLLEEEHDKIKKRSIFLHFDYGHNGSDNCMESNLPEDYYEDYYSDTVQNAYELLCSTDEVSYYLGLGFFVWYTGNKDMIDDKECRVFVLGKDLDDHIEVKNHYAVSDNQVYYLDVIENTWNILGSG